MRANSTRVESHIVWERHAFYRWAVAECAKATALYNRALYIYRQAYTGKLDNISDYADLVRKGRYMRAYDIVTRMRQLKEPTYYAMTKSGSAAQVVVRVGIVWKQWLCRLASFERKHQGTIEPRMPRYKSSGSLCPVTYSYNDARLQKDGTVALQRGLVLPLRTKVQRVLQLHMVPQPGAVRMEIVYEKSLPDHQLDASRAIGVDVGLNNLMAVTSNVEPIALLVNGRPIKSVNHYYTRAVARVTQQLHAQGLSSSRRLRRLHAKRMHMIRDYMHKASKRLVHLMKLLNLGTCVVGGIGQVVGGVPWGMFIRMLRYKVQDAGGCLQIVDEAHSSRCSFLDGERVGHRGAYAGQRVQRGLFVSAGGVAINADINASLHILQQGVGGACSVYREWLTPQKMVVESHRPSPARDRVYRGRACPGIPHGVSS